MHIRASPPTDAALPVDVVEVIAEIQLHILQLKRLAAQLPDNSWEKEVYLSIAAEIEKIAREIDSSVVGE